VVVRGDPGPLPDLGVQVLGTVTVHRNGVHVAIGGRHPRVALAILVAHRGAVVSTHRLCDALWNDDPPRSAIPTLRTLMSRLRRVLAPELAIETAPSGYRLNGQLEAVDLERFESLVATARSATGDAKAELLAAALALWNGDPFGELAEHPWLMAEARRLDELRLVLMEDYCDARLAMGAGGEIVADLERLAVEQPLRERVQVQLMTALARAGRRPEALRRGHEYRVLLADETGLDPSGAFDAIERSLLDDDAGRTGITRSSSEPLPRFLRDRGPLIGRDELLSRLRRHYEQATKGSWLCDVISGAAGTGKTHLAANFVTECSELGAMVAGAECDELVRPPLRPWIDIVTALLRLHGVSAADALAARPNLGPLLATADVSEDDGLASGDEVRHRAFDAVRDLLNDLGRVRPIVIVIDDLQWADAPTLLLTRHLVRRPGERALLLTTLRDPADIRVALLPAVLADLRRDTGVRELVVEGLHPAETAKLVRRVGDGQLSPADVERIHDETGGNPFLATEMAKHFLAGHDSDDLPPTVNHAVARLLIRLDSHATRAVELAAIVGREFAVTEVASIMGVDIDSALDCFDGAIRSGLVEDDPARADRFRFVHPILRASVLASVPRVRRARLHHLVAMNLENRAAPGGPRLEELAHHWLESIPAGASADKAARHQLEAARRGLRRFAWEDVVDRTQQILDLRLTEEAAQIRASALLLRARALTQLGDNVGARRDSLEAARIALEEDDVGLLVHGVLGIRGTGGAPATNPRDFDLVCATLDRVASGSPDRARLLGLAASHASASPEHCGRTEDLATEAVSAARAAGDPDVLRQVLEDVAITVIDRPGAQRLLDIADELDGIPTPEQLSSPTSGADRLRLTALARLGRLAEFRAVRERSTAATPAQTAALLATDVALALAQGRLAEAKDLHARHRDVVENGSLWMASWRDQETRLLLLEGNTQEVIARLEGVRERHDSVEVISTLALARAHAGDLGDAHSLATSLLEPPWRVPWNLMRPRVLSDLAQVAGFIVARDIAEAVLPMLLPYDGELLCPSDLLMTIDGAAAGLLGILEAVTDQPEAAAVHFDAGLRLERSFEAHGLTTATRVWRARLLADPESGESPDAQSELRDARVAAQELGLESLRRMASTVEAALRLR
jgi:DNA-binding SARP family transcriptional activator